MIKRYIILPAIIVFALAMNGCYYDNKQELYPLATGVCDTSAVKYSKDIAPMMTLYCNGSGCHGGTGTSGVITDNYTDLVAAINGGKFMGAVEWKSGFSAMPKGGTQLSTCNINKLKAWINAKMPNN